VRKMLSDPFWTTEQQIQTEVEGWELKTVTRPAVTADNCFDYLYYAWNAPWRIKNKTATPDLNKYVKESRDHINQHVV
jgi:hypothetical protein